MVKRRLIEPIEDELLTWCPENAEFLYNIKIPAYWGRYEISSPHFSEPYVLDIGYHQGHFLKHLKNINVPAIGIDVLDQCVYKDLDIITADVHELPFKDNLFTMVWENSIFDPRYYNNEEETAIREMTRVLQPGGLLIMIDPYYDNWTMKKINNIKEIRDVWLRSDKRISIFQKIDYF